MAALTLYDYARSGNCYKVRLLLAILGLDYQRVHVDIRAGETRTPEHLARNPRGQLPVLETDEGTLWDSMAILVYLARRFGGDSWLPRAPMAEAQVMQWLAVAANELLYGLARARAVHVLGRDFDLAQCQRHAHTGLAVMADRLAKGDWLAADHATIADLACYPYVALADEADVDLAPYPAVQGWLDRVAALPGWVPMTD